MVIAAVFGDIHFAHRFFVFFWGGGGGGEKHNVLFKDRRYICTSIMIRKGETL